LEVGGGKAEVGSWKWGVGSWKWEVGSGKAEVGKNERAECSRLKALSKNKIQFNAYSMKSHHVCERYI
jgi:hypothetical protein